MTALIVGAYASMPVPLRADPQLNVTYQADAVAATGAIGLEVPWASAAFVPDEAALLTFLASAGTHILSLASATMSRPRSEGFGLASLDEGGRQAALALARSARDASGRLAEARGERVVESVLVYSAPWCDPDQLAPHGEAFSRSLDELLSWSWESTRVLVEHCDSATGAHPGKGLLPLELELAALRGRSGAGVLINWGRSIIDTGNPDGAASHVELCRDAGTYVALALSGASDRPSDLGPAWADAHLPLGVTPSPENSFSLLTVDRVAEFVALNAPDEPVILKVASPPSRPPLEVLAESAGILRTELTRTHH